MYANKTDVRIERVNISIKILTRERRTNVASVQSLLVILKKENLKGNCNSFITPAQKENYGSKKSERRVNMTTDDGE